MSWKAVALSVAALAAPSLSVAQGTKCQLNQIAAIPLEFVSNRPLVDVAINGVKARMLIDTGASKSVLFAPKMRAMGLTPTPSDTDFIGVGGTRRALELTLKTLELGGSTGRNLRLFALESGAGGEAVGVLGEDLLIDSDVEFDLANKQLKLFREKDCAGVNLAYWSKEPAISDMEAVTDGFGMLVKLNGITIHAQLDSGAQISAVTLEAAARAGVKPTTEQFDSAAGGIGARKVEVAIASFARVTIGDEEIKNARLQVGDFFKESREAYVGGHIKQSDADLTEMFLGADFLRSHRVLVAKGQHRVYFTYQGGPVFQVVGSGGDTPVVSATSK